MLGDYHKKNFNGFRVSALCKNHHGEAFTFRAFFVKNFLSLNKKQKKNPKDLKERLVKWYFQKLYFCSIMIYWQHLEYPDIHCVRKVNLASKLTCNKSSVTMRCVFLKPLILFHCKCIAFANMSVMQIFHYYCTM